MAYFRELQQSIVIVAGPENEPVTADELKGHLRVDSDDEVGLIESYITGARELVESDTRRKLITQTLRLSLDQFPCDPIELRACPVQSLQTFTYLDPDGVRQEFEEDDWRLRLAGEPALVLPAWGAAWPGIRVEPEAVQLEFVAGWADPADVPEKAKQAIRLLVGHWFWNREAVGTVGAEIALSYESLVTRLRWGGAR